MSFYTTEWNAGKSELSLCWTGAPPRSKLVLEFEQLCAIERYLEEKRTYQPSRVDLEELVKLLVSALAKER